MSAVDLGHLGVEPEELTSGSADDTDGRAVFLACLLYASVHSAQRGDFIARIMALEQAVQQELMGSIQTITQALADAAGSDDDEEDHLESEDVATVSQLKAQIRDLSLRNEDLQETNHHLQAKLDAHANASGSVDGGASAGGAGASSGGGDADALLQDLRMAEAELQRCKDAAQLEQSELNTELQSLREELDVLRQRNRDLASAEGDAARLRQQLEEADEVKAQLKHAQGQIQEHKDRAGELEAVAKTLPELKKQLEHYKRERVELEASASAAKVAAETSKSRMAALQQEKEEATSKVQQLESELSAAKEEVSALKAAGAAQAGSAAMGDEAREQMARLQRENDALKAAAAGEDGGDSGDDGGDSALLRSQLEDAHAIRERLEAATAEAKTQAAELQLKLERCERELQAAKEASASSGAAAAQLADVQAQLSEAQAALSKSEASRKEAEQTALSAKQAADSSTQSAQEVDTLNQQLETARVATAQLAEDNTQLKSKVDKLTLYTKKLSAQHKSALEAEHARIKYLEDEKQALRSRLDSNHRLHNLEQDRMAATISHLGREILRTMLLGAGGPGASHSTTTPAGSPAPNGQSFLQQQRQMRSPLGQRVVAASRAPASMRVAFSSPLRSSAAAESTKPSAMR